MGLYPTKKGGAVRFDVEFHTLESDKGFHHIGKFLKYEKVS
jgi:hypothetical protein